jgi:hypothetical protein
MATFQVRIEDIIGATASVGSDDSSANEQAIQDALQDTAKDIINKVRPEILIQFSTKSSNVTSNPIATDIENSRILLVERREDDDTTSLYLSCVYSDSSLQGKIQNPHSIFLLLMNLLDGHLTIMMFMFILNQRLITLADSTLWTILLLSIVLAL